MKKNKKTFFIFSSLFFLSILIYLQEACIPGLFTHKPVNITKMGNGFTAIRKENELVLA